MCSSLTWSLDLLERERERERRAGPWLRRDVCAHTNIPLPQSLHHTSIFQKNPVPAPVEWVLEEHGEPFVLFLLCVHKTREHVGPSAHGTFLTVRTVVRKWMVPPLCPRHDLHAGALCASHRGVPTPPSSIPPAAPAEAGVGVVACGRPRLAAGLPWHIHIHALCGLPLHHRC